MDIILLIITNILLIIFLSLFMIYLSKININFKISLSGRFFKFCDNHLNNSKIFIKKHDSTIEIVFLTLYVFLNLCLARTIVGRAVNYFIITLLGLISLERTILHLKVKLNKEDLDKKEEKIKQQLRYYDTIIYQLKNKKKELEQRNKTLIKQKELLFSNIKRLYNKR